MIRTIVPARLVRGKVLLPGDKSISHRYAMLAALSEGDSRLRHFAASADCRSTLSCLGGLGVAWRDDDDAVVISGVGLHGLRPPRAELDAGNSGTTIRLLSGILAGQPFECCITGDESLRGRPMGRILEPLRRMGTSADARPGELPPLRLRGGRLQAVRYTLPVASAQVKSCVLFAGLYGNGATAVEEKIPTRDHTERALAHFGASVRCCGDWIEVDPEPTLRGCELDIPGDLSGAAFFLVAAALLPGSELVMSVGLNARRRELLSYLQEAGLEMSVANETEPAGEPRGDLRVRHSPALLQSELPPIEGKRAAALIDEIPVLSVLGSQAAGGLEIRDARELRIKESDRIAAIALNLRAMGAGVTEKPDGLRLQGAQKLNGADIVTRGDHRIAMAFAIAGLVARGETRVLQAECADVSFPGFFEQLGAVAESHA